MTDLVARLRSVAHTYDAEGVHGEIELEAADEIEHLRGQSYFDRECFDRALTELKVQDAEIGRLQNNAREDAKYLLAYHRICQNHGIAPSSLELLAAMEIK